MSNAPLNVQALQDQLTALAQREGISQWDLGASRSNSASVQVDRGEPKQLKASQRSSICLLYTSPSPRDNTTSRMPSSA